MKWLVALACVLAWAGSARAQTPTPTPNNWFMMIGIGDSIMTGTTLLSDALPQPPDPTSANLHLQGNDGQFHTGFIEPWSCNSAAACGPNCGTPPCGNQSQVFPWNATYDNLIYLTGPGQAAGMTLLGFGLPAVDMINCAKQGTFSYDWLPGSNLLNACFSREILAATRGQPYCVMVDLGTNDAGNTGNPALTQNALQSLFTAVRSQWGNIPIVFWEVTTNSSADLNHIPKRDAVLAAQRAILTGPLLTRLVSGNNIPLGSDAVHPNTAGYRLKGQGAAKACATMAPIAPTPTGTQVATPTQTVCPTCTPPIPGQMGSCPGGSACCGP